MKLSHAIAAGGLIWLAACTQATGPVEAVDTAAAIDAIHEIETARIAAIQSHDLDGAVAPYAEDAMFVVPGRATASTPEQIRATFEAMLNDPNTSIALRPGRAEVAAAGDLAFTNAVFETTFTDPATQQRASASGSNVTVWRRQEDGSWKVVADFNIQTPQ